MGDENRTAQEVLDEVYDSLKTKGYDPINQLTGYLLTSDPSYITVYNGARNKIRSVETEDLIVELLESYFRNR